MAKNTSTNDDEIDLIELIQLFLTHKAKFIILGIVGLSLGLVYTLLHEPRLETQFKVYIGHPAFSNDFLINSAGVQEILNTSELNEEIIPHYSYNIRKKVFVIVTKGGEVPNMVTETFENALKEQVVKIKQLAQDFKGFDKNPVIVSNIQGLQFNNQDLAKLNSDQVMSSFKLSFGSPKVLHPRPLKHGVIGIFVGLFLAFLWMMADILMRQLKKK